MNVISDNNITSSPPTTLYTQGDIEEQCSLSPGERRWEVKEGIVLKGDRSGFVRVHPSNLFSTGAVLTSSKSSSKCLGIC